MLPKSEMAESCYDADGLSGPIQSNLSRVLSTASASRPASPLVTLTSAGAAAAKNRSVPTVSRRTLQGAGQAMQQRSAVLTRPPPSSSSTTTATLTKPPPSSAPIVPLSASGAKNLRNILSTGLSPSPSPSGQSTASTGLQKQVGPLLLPNLAVGPSALMQATGQTTPAAPPPLPTSLLQFPTLTPATYADTYGGGGSGGGSSDALPLAPQADTAVAPPPPEPAPGLSTGAKVAIGAGVGVAAVGAITALVLATRRKPNPRRRRRSKR